MSEQQPDIFSILGKTLPTIFTSQGGHTFREGCPNECSYCVLQNLPVDAIAHTTTQSLSDGLPGVDTLLTPCNTEISAISERDLRRQLGGLIEKADYHILIPTKGGMRNLLLRRHFQLLREWQERLHNKGKSLVVGMTITTPTDDTSKII